MINLFSILEIRWFCHVRVCWFGLIQTFRVRFWSRGYHFCFPFAPLHLSDQCHASCNGDLTTYVAQENRTYFVTLSLLCVCVWKYAR
eukprot:jgi/Botrbrau1/18045/Bobra.0062s0033.1